MAELNTVTLPEFTDLVDRTWTKENDMDKTGPAKSMFIVDDLASHTGDSRRYTEIDTQTYASIKEEGADAAKASVQKGYEKDLIMRRFAMEIDITYEMRRLNKKPEVVANLTSLAHFCPQRMELDLTHRISFATATSYVDRDGITVDTTVGDGLALVSAVHTVKGSASTFSNVITANPVFSKAGVEIAELQANTQIVSQFYERRAMDFNTIFSGDNPETVNDIKQFLMSTAEVGQDNPGVVNVYKSKYTHTILRHLATTAAGVHDSTKSKFWGLAATGQGAMGWQAYLGIWEAPNLKSPNAGNNGEDFHNDNWSYGTRGSWGIATVSPKGFLLSAAT